MAETSVSFGAETSGNTVISPVNAPGDHAACDAETARLQARIARLEAALRRHTEFFTDSHDTELCGGCLRPSPCPDLGLLA